MLGCQRDLHLYMSEDGWTEIPRGFGEGQLNPSLFHKTKLGRGRGSMETYNLGSVKLMAHEERLNTRANIYWKRLWQQYVGLQFFLPHLPKRNLFSPPSHCNPQRKVMIETVPQDEPLLSICTQDWLQLSHNCDTRNLVDILPSLTYLLLWCR